MQRRRPPDTAAGYYVLHDFRRIDWEQWREKPHAERDRLLDEAVRFFDRAGSVEEGDFGIYSVHGHKADILFLVLRPSLRALDTFERQFAQLDFAAVTDRATSALGVTEASGYTEAAADFFDPDAEADTGIERYMNARLYPDLPSTDFLSFYFMNKRRHPEENWYDLPYEERAEHVARHGEIGKEFAGSVTQLITGSTGFDDWEWGITLFTDDMVAVKDLLTAMRFDPSTSRFAEFGPFYTADRFAPADLPALMAGEELETEADESETIDGALADVNPSVDPPADAAVVIVPSEAQQQAVAGEVEDLRGNFEHYDSHIETTVGERNGKTVVVSVWETGQAAETAAGFLADLSGAIEPRVGTVGKPGSTQSVSTDDDAASAVRSALDDADVYAGQPHGEDIHALVRFSAADTDTLRDEVDSLTTGFDRYDTHKRTDLYQARGSDRTAVVSLWDTADAAETAAGYLDDLPEAIEAAGDDGFATMGLFYRVKPEHRTDFVETFDAVGDVLADMDGHRDTDLLVNVADENDMFIASRWRDRDAAMAFFRSDAFGETVQWGRDILEGRPRHVFLA